MISVSVILSVFIFSLSLRIVSFNVSIRLRLILLLSGCISFVCASFNVILVLVEAVVFVVRLFVIGALVVSRG